MQFMSGKRVILKAIFKVSDNMLLFLYEISHEIPGPAKGFVIAEDERVAELHDCSSPTSSLLFLTCFMVRKSKDKVNRYY